MSNSYTEVVEQAIQLLQGLHKTEYTKVIKPHFPSSVGAHIRHIVDHFLAIKNACERSHAESKSSNTLEQIHINYNKRNRHGDVENEPKAAIKELNAINSWLDSLDAQQCQLPVVVTTEIDISHTKSATCASTLERELVFVSSHAIHHYALIRIICAMQSKEIPEYFGYAPATITHLNKSA